MNYQEAKEVQKTRSRLVDLSSAALNEFEKGDFGLVARTHEYIAAKEIYNQAFRKFREINKFISLKFKKEESASRLARKAV